MAMMRYVLQIEGQRFVCSVWSFSREAVVVTLQVTSLKSRVKHHSAWADVKTALICTCVRACERLGTVCARESCAAVSVLLPACGPVRSGSAEDPQGQGVAGSGGQRAHSTGGFACLEMRKTRPMKRVWRRL